MAKGKLFEFAILYHPKPTKDQRDSGETPKSEVVIEPKMILATTIEQASMLAARAIPDTHTEKLEDVEILVRPF
jgi:hypothetical protein